MNQSAQIISQVILQQPTKVYYMGTGWCETFPCLKRGFVCRCAYSEILF